MAKIYVVDDEKIIRLLLKEMLLRSGFQVETFENSAEVLARIEQEPPDLLITDIFMPEKSGLEMILELRKTHREVKIIAISGDSSGGAGAGKESLEVAAALGSSRIIKKPFTVTQVTEAVNAALAS